jgi:nucleoid-associated protein EbfC
VFDAFKTAGALAGLMKNKEGLKQAGDRIKQRLGELRAVGSAGGGAVSVTVSGQMKVLQVTLSPALAANLTTDTSSRAMAESLIAEAVNDALAQAQQAAHREIKKEADALGLPSIPGLETLLGA